MCDNKQLQLGLMLLLLLIVMIQKPIDALDRLIGPRQHRGLPVILITRREVTTHLIPSASLPASERPHKNPSDEHVEPSMS